jgi:transposase-like protein
MAVTGMDAVFGTRNADIGEQRHLLRSAVILGAEATAERANKLQRKHQALFVRLRDRRDDYLRFFTNRAVPFDNNSAEQTIRMPKLRIKVSGCMRTLAGAERLAAIRSYTATATATAIRQSINMLDAPHPSRHRQPLDPCHRLNESPYPHS